MSFSRLYRASFYLMLFLATLALSVDVARENPVVPLFPVAVALGGIVAFFSVDRDPRRAIAPELASLLAFGSVALFLIEWGRDNNQLLLALGHWLVYLQLIKMFRPKTVEDDWFLFLLSLTQVVVGAFLPGESIGLVLIVWAIVALWTLRLFHLQREAEAQEAVFGPLREIYPGLVDRPFVLSIGRVAILTVSIGAAIFLVMPRWDSERGRRFRPRIQPHHLTGFSDSVKLGQMGEILENDTIVMNVELFNELDERIEPDDEPLWRGVTLQDYENGRWTRWDVEGIDWESPERTPYEPGQFILQRIKLEPSDTDTLFGLRPIYDVTGPDIAINVQDGSLFRLDIRPIRPSLRSGRRTPGALDYSVISSTERGAIQPYERVPAFLEKSELIALPEDLRPTLLTLRDRVLANVPRNPEARARAMESFLREGGYRYTLQQSVVDPSLDPVADFLVNRKQGHCEYFASALALLLRSANIPSRVVNGFKGGDWNTLARVYYVRQKHAHSWVEAYIGDDARGRPIWLTLDPTPPAQRDATVAQVGNVVNRRFRTITDFARYIWVFYFVGFDSTRQEALIYGPVRQLWNEAIRGSRLIAAVIVRGVRWLLHFPDLTSLFSARGFVVSFAILSLLAMAFRGLRWLVRRLGWGGSSANDRHDESSASLLAYRRLVLLMAAVGLRRPASETPREFARRAGEFLDALGPESSMAAGTPLLVVDAFYGVRYGLRPLAEAEAGRLDRALDALEGVLQPPAPGAPGRDSGRASR